MALNSPKIIDIVKIEDYRGNLSVLQHPSPLPFVPARAYWIHDVPSGMMREGHAYNCSQELIIALSGRIDVTTQGVDGNVQTFTLSKPNEALYVPQMTWRELHNFATNSAVLIVTDTLYDEDDYIRSKDDYNKLIDNLK